MERGFADFERGLTHLLETISVIDDLPYTFEQAVRRQGKKCVPVSPEASHVSIAAHWKSQIISYLANTAGTTFCRSADQAR